MQLDAHSQYLSAHAPRFVRVLLARHALAQPKHRLEFRVVLPAVCQVNQGIRVGDWGDLAEHLTLSPAQRELRQERAQFSLIRRAIEIPNAPLHAAHSDFLLVTPAEMNFPSVDLILAQLPKDLEQRGQFFGTIPHGRSRLAHPARRAGSYVDCGLAAQGPATYLSFPSFRVFTVADVSGFCAMRLAEYDA